jgi:hypothetical protein
MKNQAGLSSQGGKRMGCVRRRMRMRDNAGGKKTELSF